jgi:hypothetical protein
MTDFNVHVGSVEMRPLTASIGFYNFTRFYCFTVLFVLV